MASSLQALRKAAGYKTAKEFAEEMGIPLATYSRYESSPEKIPLGAAWSLADKLGASIDVVVGRLQEPVASLRGNVQLAYDELSPRLRDALDEYLGYLSAKNAEERKRLAEQEAYNCGVVCSRLERVFLAKLEAQGSDLVEFGTEEQMRAAFQEFLEGRAQERRGSGVRVPLDKIMDAYDRLHGSFDLGDEWDGSYRIATLTGSQLERGKRSRT